MTLPINGRLVQGLNDRIFYFGGYDKKFPGSKSQQVFEIKIHEKKIVTLPTRLPFGISNNGSLLFEFPIENCTNKIN